MARRVLILCTGNSARSQMAEGLLRQVATGEIEVFSAGTQPTHLHPLAIRVMEEVGIDISAQRSKHLNEFRQLDFDDVVTVCDTAAESCPVFRGGTRHTHWSLPDPAAVSGSEEEQLESFRRVRDSLSTRLEKWLQS